MVVGRPPAERRAKPTATRSRSATTAPSSSGRDGCARTTLEVVVSPEDDGEGRRVTIATTAPRPRDIEVTSFAELVLAPQAADNAHPAFSNMFVETEYRAGAA